MCSAAESAGELPAVRTEIACRVKTRFLLADGDLTHAAGARDEILSSVLERPLGSEEIADEHGSTGSLFHPRKAIGEPDSAAVTNLGSPAEEPLRRRAAPPPPTTNVNARH